MVILVLLGTLASLVSAFSALWAVHCLRNLRTGEAHGEVHSNAAEKLVHDWLFGGEQ